MLKTFSHFFHTHGNIYSIQVRATAVCRWKVHYLKRFSHYFHIKNLKSYLIDNYHRPLRSRRLLPVKVAGLAEVRLR